MTTPANKPKLVITNTFSDLVTKFNTVSIDLGATGELNTSQDSDVVGAINELEVGIRGTSNNLVATDLTTSANDLVGAINELESDLFNAEGGTKRTLSSLTTTDKTCIVDAINELDTLQGNITLGTDASTITGAIAEIETALRGSTANYTLTTSANDLVGAINEIEGVFDASAKGISAGTDAFNVVSGAFTIDASGTITLDAATTALTGDLTLVDDEKIKLGTGADLQIYHDGDNSIIDETGEGNLFVRATNVNIQNVDADPDENMARFVANGAVELYHNNVKKFETTANGIVVTGSTIANGIVSITDNNSDISPDNTGSGHLRIDGNGYKAAIALDADGVNLYSTSGAKPLIFGVNETEVSRVTTTGMNVTGTLNLSSHLDMPDDAQIKLGDDDDFILQHEAGGITEILAQQLRIKNLAATETLASFNADGSTNLFYDGEGRLGTSNTGVAILNNKNLELGSPVSITSGGNTAITFAGANITIAGNATVSGTLSVGSLTTTNQTVKLAINELHTDIGTNTSAISSNDTDISTINTKLGTITTGVMLTSASNVGAAIGELHGDIGTNTAAITANTSARITNATNIGTNTTNIGTNATNIGTLSSLSSDITNDGNLVAAINELQGDINQINTSGASANNTIIGTLSNLNTVAQNNVVSAINENHTEVSAATTKLSGIEAGADVSPTAGTNITISGGVISATNTNTTYSTATSSTLGLVKIGYTQNSKNYPVQLSSGQMFVNVPWNTDGATDTNTQNTYNISAVSVSGGSQLRLGGSGPTATATDNVKFASGGATTVTQTDPSTITISSTDTNTQRAIHDTPVDGATTTSISSNWAFDNVKTSVPSGAVFTDNNTQLSNEQVQDIVGGMLGGTETGITVTYQDGTGDIDFVIDTPFTNALLTKLNGIATGATVDQTKSDIDALNIDADTLDGQHGSYYATAASVPLVFNAAGTQLN
jgi:hypothetical protein